MSESNFWKEMKDNIGHLGHFSRVESPQTSAGIPDIDFCIKGSEGHVELKYGKDDKVPKLRPSQVKWFSSRQKAGGRPIIIAKLIVDGETRYCFYSASKVSLLYEAKTTLDWVRLSDLTFATSSPNWESFMFIIKDMTRTRPEI